MSMIAGAGPDQHGVYTNAWRRGDSIPGPTIFALTRAARGPAARIACVYEWDGFGRLVEDDAPDLKSNPCVCRHPPTHTHYIDHRPHVRTPRAPWLTSSRGC
jgi:hypothetical protein